MRRMDNIYRSVDSYLQNNGYEYASIDEKKEMTVEGIKQYLSKIITDINPTISKDKLNELDINQTIDIITSILPEQDHESNLSNVIRYLLQNASQLQGRKITWERETSEDLDNGVSIEFNNKGNITTVKTHTYPSYNYVLRFLIDIYQCPLFVKQKQLVKAKKDK